MSETFSRDLLTYPNSVIKVSPKVTAKHKNIGDYIQSIAALQFAGHDALCLEREQLHAYEGPPVSAIMNAYYMHCPENWPPSDQIKPLPISMHIQPSCAELMLNTKGLAWFQQHQPIGCRDINTEKLLKSHGISAYFSGCLTLTLGEQYKLVGKRSGVVFVDPYYDRASLRRWKNLLKATVHAICNPLKLMRMRKRMFRKMGPINILKTSWFHMSYRTYFTDQTLLKATYLTHAVGVDSSTTEDDLFAIAHHLIGRYAKAELLVTSRMHAALPGLALDTPTIFVDADFLHKGTKAGRLGGSLGLLNVLRYERGRIKSSDENIPEPITLTTNITNKQLHVPLAEQLSRQCEAFVNQPKKPHGAEN